MKIDTSPNSDETLSASPETQESETALQPGVSQLSEQLKKFIEKLDVPKRKDAWDILSVLTSFLGTVIVAAISLYLTQSFQRMEAQRAREFQAQEASRAAQFTQAQIESKRAQIRVEELKAMTTLAPLLASSDPVTRETARQLLQAVRDTGGEEAAVGTRGASTSPPQDEPKPAQSLLDQFARIALSTTISQSERIEATRRIGEIATAPSTGPAEREHAASIAAQIAKSEDTPPEVKQAASEVIAKIRLVSPAEVVHSISTQPIKRKVTEVILHHSATPAERFRGTDSILAFARFLLTEEHWNQVSWHFAVAPDGSFWLGAPLDEKAIHVVHHNDTSISIMLIMDGDKELPTEAQRRSLALVLRSLFDRLKIREPLNSPAGSGFHFHRDYAPGKKSCPGALLTKQMVLGWLQTNALTSQ